MRSSYWGQGGHNAILLVGDFFKAAIDSGRIQAAAQFPGGPRLAPGRAAEPEEVEAEVMEEGGEMLQEGAPPPEENPDLQISPEEPEQVPEEWLERRQDRDAEVDRQIELDRQQQLERRFQERRQQPQSRERDYQERRRELQSPERDYQERAAPEF
jgi:penicillin-binding protein 1A